MDAVIRRSVKRLSPMRRLTQATSKSQIVALPTDFLKVQTAKVVCLSQNNDFALPRRGHQAARYPLSHFYDFTRRLIVQLQLQQH